MSKVQIIIIIVFSLAALIAVLIFSGILPGFRSQGPGAGSLKITMWGIFPKEKIMPLIQKANDENRSLFTVNYEEKNPSTYENELLNVLASGQGPAVWFLRQDKILNDKDKIFLIPFASYTERDFIDTFIDSASLFIDKGYSENETGILGFPLAIDPIVLYWNRDLFSSAGISRPPQYWEEFISDVQLLTKKDDAGNLLQSGAALGQFSNVNNAKDILSLLILQTGNPIIDPQTMDVLLGEKGNALIDPTEAAVRFFDDFSNPGKTSYCWNKAMSNADQKFVNGSLAMYFGYASELADIKEKNPHLNFDIAEVPQIKDGQIRATFGRVYSLVISKNSVNKQAAFSAIFKLTGYDFSKSFSKALGLGSARRDLLAEKTTDPALAIIFKSSTMSRNWLEPDSDTVSGIFKNMIESTLTGQAHISEAVSSAKKQIEQLLK